MNKNVLRLTIAAVMFLAAASVISREQRTAAAEEDVDFSAAIAFMKPSTTVLTVGKLKMSWKEYQPVLKRAIPKGDNNPSNQVLKSVLKGTLQAIAKRGILFQETDAREITVTPEEQKLFEEELSEGLKANDKGFTLEGIKAALSKKTSTMVELTYPDMLRVVKLQKELTAEVKVEQDEYDYYMQYQTLVNKGIEEQNQKMKDNINGLFDDPSINTDAGFASLAQKYSEGTEAAWGGELQVDFTREQLALVNETDSFDYKAGETTPFIETSSAYRIMRVLKVIPPEKEGEPEKLRVAQMLFTKLDTNDLSDTEAIKKKILDKKIKYVQEQKVQELSAKYPVITPFFPDGLWEKK